MSVTIDPIHSDYHFILNCYTPADIEAVMDNVRRHSEGYEFLYVVDPYDIVENYLPYTQGALFSNNDVNYQAQKFICYDYFFGGINKTEAILLNEYQVELFAAKNKLNKLLKDAQIAIQNLDALKEGTNDFLGDPEKMAAFVRDHFEVILLLLILNDKSRRILDEFFAFIRTRLNTHEVNAGKEKDREKINQIFDSSRHTSFTVDVFKAYVGLNSLLLTTKDPDERDIFLENTFRDIKAIERVLQINRSFAAQELKYVTIYLSSARKTKEIFKLVPYFQPDNPTSLHLNMYQYFLFDRIRNEFGKEPDKALEILMELKELLSKIGTLRLSEKSESKETYQLLELVKRLFDERSSILDNHFYISVYDRYKAAFKNFLNPGANNPIKGDELLEIVRSIDENRKEYLERISSLELELSQLNQTYDIVDTFRGIDDFEPDYRAGKDIVSNPYQHLPILFLMKPAFNSTLKNKLYAFLNTNIELAENDKPQLKQYVQEIVQEVSALPTGTLRTKFLKSIVITYLNFVVQSKTSQLNLQEDSHIADLEKHYEIIRIQFRKIDLTGTYKNNALQFIYGETDLLTEVMYLLIWLYRRSLREEEGIQKAVSHMREFDDDARICQGIGLCYVSKAYRVLTAKEADHIHIAKDNIELALKYLRLAAEKFKIAINANDHTLISSVLIKNYIAILNSIADMYVRRYSLINNTDAYAMIESARGLIDEIKMLFNTINLFFEDHPVYCATEIEIEYYEAQYCFSIGQISFAQQKINDVSRRYAGIKYWIDLQTNSNEFICSGADINRLMEKIVKHNLKV